MSANDLDVGRNVEEIVRLVEAFNFAKAHGSVCPANWHKGAPTVIDIPCIKYTNIYIYIAEASTWGECRILGERTY